MFSGDLQQNTKVGSSRKAEADQEQVRVPYMPKTNSTELSNTSEHQNLLNRCLITGWKQQSINYLKTKD